MDLILHTSDSVQKISLHPSKATYRIGRKIPGNPFNLDIEIKDLRVSRQHATLTWESRTHEWKLYDGSPGLEIRSSNGIFYLSQGLEVMGIPFVSKQVLSGKIPFEFEVIGDSLQAIAPGDMIIIGHTILLFEKNSSTEIDVCTLDTAY